MCTSQDQKNQTTKKHDWLDCEQPRRPWSPVCCRLPCNAYTQPDRHSHAGPVLSSTGNTSASISTAAQNVDKIMTNMTMTSWHRCQRHLPNSPLSQCTTSTETLAAEFINKKSMWFVNCYCYKLAHEIPPSSLTHSLTHSLSQDHQNTDMITVSHAHQPMSLHSSQHDECRSVIGAAVGHRMTTVLVQTLHHSSPSPFSTKWNISVNWLNNFGYKGCSKKESSKKN